MKSSLFACDPEMHSFLYILTIFLVIPTINNVGPVLLTVNGPLQPVTACLSGDIVLRCHLYPRTSAQNMEIKWFRSQNASYVHLYRDGKDDLERQQPEYQGRTEFLKDGLGDGKIELKILSVNFLDEGQYHCSVKNGSFHQEAILDMKLAASGSAPLIAIEGYQGRGIRVVCRSRGWYPEPEVLWRDNSGRPLPSLAIKLSQMNDGLLEVQNEILVTGNSNQNLTCVVRNILLNQDQESTIQIASHFFPKISPWIVSLSVLLIMAVLVFTTFILYLLNRNGKLNADLSWRNLVMPIEKGKNSRSFERFEERESRTGEASNRWAEQKTKLHAKEKQKVLSAFQHLKHFLEEQEGLLLAQLEQLKETSVTIRDEHLRKFSDEVTRLSTLIAEVENKCQQPASEFLQ